MDRVISYRFAVTAALGICILAFAAGFVIPKDSAVQLTEFARQYLTKVQFSFTGIFFNNLTAALIIYLGAFLLCLPSLLSISINFMLLGATLRLFGPEKGPVYFAVSLLPHGIFEIPAIILSLVLSIHTVELFTRKYLMSEDITLSSELRQTAMLFIKVVIPLLLIAALVETNLTPLLMRYVQ